MQACLHRNVQLIATLALCLTWVLFAGCNGTESGNPENIDPSLSGDMTGFHSNAELEAYLKEQYRGRVYSDYPYDLENTAVRNGDFIGEGVDLGGGAGDGSTGGGGPEAPVVGGRKHRCRTDQAATPTPTSRRPVWMRPTW